MRDPFNAPIDLINADRGSENELMRNNLMSAGRRSANELTRSNLMSAGRDYELQNGDSRPLASNSDTLVSHPLKSASLHNDLITEDPNARMLDPGIKELYFRSRSQEEEILLLRKQIADACSKELHLLNEKHILERKLSDLRMAVDEKQDDAIAVALKQLNQKKTYLEENLRLTNELKVEEEEVFLFTSSLLSLLAEYNVRPPLLNASTITSGTKRLYQQMQWKIRSLNDSLGDMNQPGNLYNVNPQQTIPSRKEPSLSYNVDGKMNNFRQYQHPNDPHAEQMFHRSGLIQDFSGMNVKDVVAATPSYFEENTGDGDPRLDGDSQFYVPTGHDNQDYSLDGDIPSPGIEGFQIVGDPKPGHTLTACGFPLNGTTLCNFQWVRYLENGTRQSIEGATMYDYVVTADDVNTVLAVDCTPMDDNGRQGELVREFANNQNKITCDLDMQHEIDSCISNWRALFNIFVLVYPSDDWELATLMLKRSGYQIKLKHKEEVVIEEKYSPDLYIKVPNGRSTQFVLVSSGGVNLPFNTGGTTEPNSEDNDNDIRLRDMIVLVMRTFQNKALDVKRKGKA